LPKADDGVVDRMSEPKLPEATPTLELAKRFRDAAAAANAMPHYAEMMLRAAADLEAFARNQATPALLGMRSAA
jgi:hypothetical protein